jgi:hypothetical protein
MILRQLQSAKFELNCFKGVDQNRLFVLLDMKIEDIEEEAEDMMFPVKIIKESAKVPFDRQKRTEI